MPSILANINDNLINLLPAVAEVEPIARRRRFNVSPCVVSVGIRKAFADERSANTSALMSGRDAENLEYWRSLISPRLGDVAAWRVKWRYNTMLNELTS